MKRQSFFVSIVVFIMACLGCEHVVITPEVPPQNDKFGIDTTAIVASASIPTNGLVAWYRLNLGSGDDNTTSNNNGTSYNVTAAPNRSGSQGLASRFNGYNSYIEIPDKDYLSISKTGKLSISIWMKIETLNFTNTTNDYVHWFGKGTSGKHEYTFRMYNKVSARPNRISCYAFNLSGGLGAGSYFQDVLSVGQWIHVVAIYDYPNDQIRLYKNGVLQDTDTFSGYGIIPQNGAAPLRIGTRDFANYFKGCLDDLRIYNRVLTQSEINALAGV